MCAQNNKRKWSIGNRNAFRIRPRRWRGSTRCWIRRQPKINQRWAKNKTSEKEFEKVKIPPPAPCPNHLSRSQAALQVLFLAGHLDMTAEDLWSILPMKGLAIHQVSQDQLLRKDATVIIHWQPQMTCCNSCHTLQLAVTICVRVTLLQLSHISATTLVTTLILTPLDSSYTYIGVPRRRNGTSIFSSWRTQTSYH
jgi:hypothetical protein